MLVEGGGGTRYDCLGGDDESERSTLTYVSYASPREDSGIHARSRLGACMLLAEAEVEGRASFGSGGDFCCMRAIKPAMLSFAEGVGWT